MGFGKSQVSGRNLVPEPPAISTARIKIKILLLCEPSLLAALMGLAIADAWGRRKTDPTPKVMLFTLLTASQNAFTGIVC
jgi:hypothetical protein